MMVSSLLLLAMLCLTQASAHICLTYPMMRGPQPSLYPGDNLCFQRTPDCGALVKGAPTATFVAGTPTSLRFQQNLNHWYQPRPGYFDLAVSYDGEQTWEMLATVSDFPANNMNTQTYFNVPVIFTKPAASAVVRARYVSHNPNEIDPANNTDAIFYSCSDVEVVAPGNWGPSMLKAAMKPVHKLPTLLRNAAATKPSVGVVGESCVTPPRWSAIAIEYDFQGSPVMSHQIVYDTFVSMVRWTRTNTNFGGTYMMTDYWNTTLLAAGYTPQWIVGLSGPNTCSMYGGDAFFPWQFGAQNGMKFTGNTSDFSNTIMNFEIPANGMKLSAVVQPGKSTCLPRTWSLGENIVRMNAQEATSFPASTFVLPPACTQQRPDAGCWAHRH